MPISEENKAKLQVLYENEATLLALYNSASQALCMPDAYETKLAAIKALGEFLLSLFPGQTSTEIADRLNDYMFEAEPSSAEVVRAHDFNAIDTMIEASAKAHCAISLADLHATYTQGQSSSAALAIRQPQILSCGIQSFLVLLHGGETTRLCQKEASFLARPNDLIRESKSPFFCLENDPDVVMTQQILEKYALHVQAFETLQSAILSGNVDLLDMGYTQLLEACENDIEKAGVWINRYLDKKGNTLLHQLSSVSGLHVPMNLIVPKLARMGIDFKIQNFKGHSALHLAILKGKILLFLTLIDNVDKGHFLLLTDNHGCSVLHYAVLTANENMVHQLLRLGMDPMLPDNQGNSALDQAFRMKNARLCQLLISYCQHLPIHTPSLDLFEREDKKPLATYFSEQSSYMSKVMALTIKLKLYREKLIASPVQSVFLGFFSIPPEQKQSTIDAFINVLQGDTITVTKEIIEALQKDSKLTKILTAAYVKAIINIENLSVGSPLRLLPIPETPSVPNHAQTSSSSGYSN